MATRCKYPRVSFPLSLPSTPAPAFPPPLPIFQPAFTMPCPLD